MAYPDDDTTPYWASTVPVLGLDDGRPKGPLDLPLEFLLSGQFARALSEASNPRIPADLMPFPRVPSHMLPPASPMGDWSSNPSLPTPANVSAGFASPPARLPPSFAPAPPVEHLDAGKYWGSSSALPEAPAPSSAHGFYHSPIPQAPSWDSVPQPADNAAQSFWQPPSPPSWDVPVPPVEYPDLARYWGAPPAPSAANEPPPTGLWVTESSAPQAVPRALTPADLARRSRDAENALALARFFAPDLVDYLTTPAPLPKYTPNAAGKIPPIDYHPNEAGAGVDALLNILSLPAGGLGKVATAAAPMAARIARGATKTALPMDAASIAQRAKAMNMADDVFWRGERSGALPTSYPEGAYFSRLKERGDAFAQHGGRPEAREFRLDLTKALKDYEPVTAEQIGRLVASAARHDPKWAAELVDMVAPGRSIDWMLGFAKARPNDLVADSGAHIRQMIDYSANPVRILRDAGFNALDNGVDVRKLDGYGIRLANAVFDPARRRSKNISAALAGGSVAPTLAEILMNPRSD